MPVLIYVILNSVDVDYTNYVLTYQDTGVALCISPTTYTDMLANALIKHILNKTL